MSLGLQELLQWVKSIDPSKTEEQKRAKVICYRDMIIDRVKVVNELTTKMQRYMKDIEEYVEWLKKLGVPLFEEPKKEVITEVPFTATLSNKDGLVYDHPEHPLKKSSLLP